ncbi:RHS repeat-associated core domain-containing protein, partial [Parapedobacter sp. DT-150]|uniref:RHS repeat-associated core domain-containing protein n=1 Tax=Parapedobacter sp. DT-150 TaxID=3396162 RepID=UPI003F1BC358
SHEGRLVASPENNYLYNGKELQEELGLYDYGARFYDPVIGRWGTVDKLAAEPEQIDKSPYAYGWNNPTNLTDPDGNCPSCLLGGLIGAAVEYGSQVAANVYENGFTASALTDNIDVGDIAISAVEGFVTSGGSVVKNLVVKGGITLAAEIARNAVDVKDGTVTTNSVKSTAVNTAVGLAAGKVADKAPGPKVKAANAPTPKEAVKVARANGPVNRTQRIKIENEAKANQKTAKAINSTVSKAPGGIIVGGATEEAKRKLDKNNRVQNE